MQHNWSQEEGGLENASYEVVEGDKQVVENQEVPKRNKKTAPFYQYGFHHKTRRRYGLVPFLRLSHVKYSLNNGDAARTVIARQLNDGNTLDIDFIIPEQGEVISL